MNYKSAGYFRTLQSRIETMASDAVDKAIKDYVGETAWEPIRDALGKDRMNTDYNDTLARGILMGISIARNKQAYETLVRQCDTIADYFSMGLVEGSDT